MAEGASHTVHLTSPTDGTSCGAVDNTAVVAALNEAQDATGNNQASASLLVICPAIQITKTVDPKSGNPGDTVTYTYVVKNVGDTTLYDVSVDDDVIGHIGDIARLDPGDSVTLTKDFVLPAGSPVVTNVGTATGTDVLGHQVSDDDDAFVTIVEAANPPPATPPTAFTGSDAARLGLIAGLMLVVGVVALILGRRRREI
jgi:LPXTG-motif cell wall-anchored protein